MHFCWKLRKIQCGTIWLNLLFSLDPENDNSFPLRIYSPQLEHTPPPYSLYHTTFGRNQPQTHIQHFTAIWSENSYAALFSSSIALENFSYIYKTENSELEIHPARNTTQIHYTYGKKSSSPVGIMRKILIKFAITF